MRAIQFAKIDFIKTKQQILWILLVIPVILLFMLQSSGEPMPLVVFCYALFMALIFSTTPFGSCQRQETGFLLLLPATTRDRISGRFLYGLSFMVVSALIGGVGMYLGEMISGAVAEAEILAPFCMVAFAVCMVLMALEYVIFYLFGEQQSPNILSLIRMIPGFVFFFGSMSLIGDVQDDPEPFLALMEYIDGHLMLIGWCSVVAAFVLFAVAAMLCTAVTKKRDFG